MPAKSRNWIGEARQTRSGCAKAEFVHTGKCTVDGDVTRKRGTSLSEISKIWEAGGEWGEPRFLVYYR